MPPTNWERGRVPFKFQFGDLVFGRVHLSLLRRNATLDEPALNIGDIPEPPPRLAGADGYVVWSHPIATRLPVLSARNNQILYAPRQYKRFSIDLSGDFERYMSRFSGKTRSTLRRKVRRFADSSGGTIDWREYRTPQALSVFFPLAKSLSAKTYQERLLNLGLPASEVFVSASLKLAENDSVRAYLLFLQGVAISYLYCTVSQNVVYYDHLGYDPAHSALSPGTVLQLLALEALFAEHRFTSFDFTEGEGPHKELFATDSRLCGDIYVLCRRFAPALLVRLHHSIDRISAGAGSALDSLKLRASFRKLLRQI